VARMHQPRNQGSLTPVAFTPAAAACCMRPEATNKCHSADVAVPVGNCRRASRACNVLRPPLASFASRLSPRLRVTQRSADAALLVQRLGNMLRILASPEQLMRPDAMNKMMSMQSMQNLTSIKSMAQERRFKAVERSKTLHVDGEVSEQGVQAQEASMWCQDARMMPAILVLGGQGGKGVRWISVAKAEHLMTAMRELLPRKRAPRFRGPLDAGAQEGAWQLGQEGARQLGPGHLEPEMPALPASATLRELEAEAVGGGADGSGWELSGEHGHDEHAHGLARQRANVRSGRARVGNGSVGRWPAGGDKLGEETPESAMEWTVRELLPVSRLQAGMRVRVLVVGREEGEEYHLEDALVVHACDVLRHGCLAPSAAGRGALEGRDAEELSWQLSSQLSSQLSHQPGQLQRMLTVRAAPDATAVGTGDGEGEGATMGSWAADVTLTVAAHTLMQAWQVCAGARRSGPLCCRPPAPRTLPRLPAASCLHAAVPFCSRSHARASTHTHTHAHMHTCTHAHMRTRTQTLTTQHKRTGQQMDGGRTTDAAECREPLHRRRPRAALGSGTGRHQLLRTPCACLRKAEDPYILWRVLRGGCR